VLSRLDTLVDEFNLPAYVSEFHILLWTDAEWADADEAKRAAQADYVRDLLIAAFSHPVVETVAVWNFWAGGRGGRPRVSTAETGRFGVTAMSTCNSYSTSDRPKHEAKPGLKGTSRPVGSWPSTRSRRPMRVS